MIFKYLFVVAQHVNMGDSLLNRCIAHLLQYMLTKNQGQKCQELLRYTHFNLDNIPIFIYFFCLVSCSISAQEILIYTSTAGSKFKIKRKYLGIKFSDTQSCEQISPHSWLFNWFLNSECANQAYMKFLTLFYKMLTLGIEPPTFTPTQHQSKALTITLENHSYLVRTVIVMVTYCSHHMTASPL